VNAVTHNEILDKLESCIEGITWLRDNQPEPTTQPDPESGFTAVQAVNRAGWRHMSHTSSSYRRYHVSLGVDSSWKWYFRFLNIDNGESYYVPAPSGIWYNPGVQCDLCIHGNKLILWGGTASGQGIIAYECTLVGTPVVAVTLDKTEEFGDADSRAMSGIFLKSGGFVGTWYQHTATDRNNLLVGVAYKYPDGGWINEQYDMEDGTGGRITSCNGHTVIQHPADDGTWVFYKRDSYHHISALRLSEDLTDLTDLEENTQLYPKFISDRTTRWVTGHAPEGENPSLEAVACPDRGTIILGVQSNIINNFRIEYTDGVLTSFVKGAYPLFTEIDVDGNYSGNQFNLEQWHERLADFGLLYHDNKLWVTHHNLDESVPEVWKTPIQIYGSSYDFSTDTWAEPIELGLLKGHPLNNLNQPHSEAQNINALTFHSPDNITTLVTVAG
jgi:hypothetical protein